MSDDICLSSTVCAGANTLSDRQLGVLYGARLTSWRVASAMSDWTSAISAFRGKSTGNPATTHVAEVRLDWLHALITHGWVATTENYRISAG
jgi:hypothetical protein